MMLFKNDSIYNRTMGEKVGGTLLCRDNCTLTTQLVMPTMMKECDQEANVTGSHLVMEQLTLYIDINRTISIHE